MKAFWANLAFRELREDLRLFFGQSQLFTFEFRLAKQEVVNEDDALSCIS
jgi:hypothetical protein